MIGSRHWNPGRELIPACASRKPAFAFHGKHWDSLVFSKPPSAKPLWNQLRPWRDLQNATVQQEPSNPMVKQCPCIKLQENKQARGRRQRAVESHWIPSKTIGKTTFCRVATGHPFPGSDRSKNSGAVFNAARFAKSAAFHVICVCV